jgi:hypothetical protein
LTNLFNGLLGSRLRLLGCLDVGTGEIMQLLWNIPTVALGLGSFAFAISAAQPAHAAPLLAYEGFNYANNASLHGTVVGNDETLWNGQSGGTGWGSAWGVPGGATGSVVTVTTPDLSYTDSFSNSVQTTGEVLHHARVSRSSIRQFDSEYNSTTPGVYWLSFLVQPNTSGVGDAADAAHAVPLRLDNKNGGSNDAKLSVGNISTGNANYGISGFSTSSFSNVPTLKGVTRFLVVRYQIGTAANDGSVHLFVNPSNLGVEPTLASANASILNINSALMTFDRLSVSAGATPDGGDTSDNRAYFDEIRLGTTYSDVTTVVPEPATLGLLALGAVGLLGRRRAAMRPN